MHDSFTAHYRPALHPAQASPLGYLMEAIARGLGVAVKACTSLLWLAGWHPFNLLSLLRGRPPAPPPLPAPAASQQSAVTVPRRISALHREERISANHSAHLHTRSQRSTWALWAAPLLYKIWQSHHTDSTSSTLTAEGSSQDHSFSNWIIFFFCHLRTLYRNLFSGTLWPCK